MFAAIYYLLSISAVPVARGACGMLKQEQNEKKELLSQPVTCSLSAICMACFCQTAAH
jgi:hypothetical protein